MLDLEDKRQFFHMGVGLAMIAVLHVFGRGVSLVLIALGTIIGLAVINLMLLGVKLPFLSGLVEQMERKGVRFPGYGSSWFAVGALIAFLALKDPAEIAATMILLGFGDGFATIVGKRGLTPLPWNGKKSAEGFLAFMVGSLPVYFLVGPVGLVLALVCAIVESLPMPFDDNVVIPVTAVLFFVLV
ncbi:MAG: diacylglycerol/polyprenol kinase family protein [Candidatus Bilamarchaeaceae archaeon]